MTKYNVIFSKQREKGFIVETKEILEPGQSIDIWGHLGQLGPGRSKFLTTKNYLNTTKITILQKTVIFKVLNFNKTPLKLPSYKKQ